MIFLRNIILRNISSYRDSNTRSTAFESSALTILRFFSNVSRSEVDRNLGKRQMCINLLRSTSSAIEGTKTQFTITDSRGKVHKFKAFDMKERSKWLSRIHSIVNAHSSVQQAREEKCKRTLI